MWISVKGRQKKSKKKKFLNHDMALLRREN